MPLRVADRADLDALAARIPLIDQVEVAQLQHGLELLLGHVG
jgi:hypothetical protein